MKKRTCLTIPFVIVFSVLTSVAAKGQARSEIRKACLEGADIRVEFHVVDDLGCSVSNATVEALFDMVDRSKATRKSENTDDVGNCVFEALCGGQIKLKVEKPGYYGVTDQVSLLTADDELMAGRVRDGRWQPWGLQKSICLRPIRNPAAQRARGGTFRYVKTTQKWIGFDIQKYDYVTPYGEGLYADFEINFDWNGKWRNREYTGVSVSIRFPQKHAGGYYRDLVLNSEFPGVYKAETNEVYNQTFNFNSRAVRDRRGRVIKYDGEKFNNAKTLVVRSRCQLDEDGQLKSANYAQISFFKFACTEAGVGIAFNCIYNQTPNDANLEPER